MKRTVFTPSRGWATCQELHVVIFFQPEPGFLFLGVRALHGVKIALTQKIQRTHDLHRFTPTHFTPL